MVEALRSKTILPPSDPKEIKEVDPKPLAVIPGENLNPQDHKKIKDLAIIFQGFNTMRQVIQTAADNFSFPLADSDFLTHIQRACPHLSNFTDIANAIGYMGDLGTSPSDRKTARKTITYMAKIYKNPTEDLEVDQIEIQNGRQLDIVLGNLFLIVHDVKNHLTSVKGFASLIDMETNKNEPVSQRNKDSYINQLKRANEIISSVTTESLVTKEHPLRNRPFSYAEARKTFYRIFCTQLLHSLVEKGKYVDDYFSMEDEVSDEFSDYMVWYEPPLLERLAENNVQNVINAFARKQRKYPERESEPKKVQVRFSRVKIDEEEYLQVVIGHTGDPFPQHIIDNGFDGFSTELEHGGSGIGMRSHEEVIKSFGGRLNFKNPDETSNLTELYMLLRLKKPIA